MTRDRADKTGFPLLLLAFLGSILLIAVYIGIRGGALGNLLYVGRLMVSKPSHSSTFEFKILDAYTSPDGSQVVYKYISEPIWGENPEIGYTHYVLCNVPYDSGSMQAGHSFKTKFEHNSVLWKGCTLMRVRGLQPPDILWVDDFTIQIIGDLTTTGYQEAGRRLDPCGNVVLVYLESLPSHGSIPSDTTAIPAR